jgi:hypothetical protein
MEASPEDPPQKLPDDLQISDLYNSTDQADFDRLMMSATEASDP